MENKDIRKVFLKVLKGYNVYDKKTGFIKIAHDPYTPYLHYFNYGSSAIKVDNDILEEFTWLLNTIFKGYTLKDFTYKESQFLNINKENLENIKKGVL